MQALDEEEGGALPAWWRRWQRRFSCGICCSPSAPGSKGDSSGAGNPGWLRLQSYKFRLMTVRCATWQGLGVALCLSSFPSSSKPDSHIAEQPRVAGNACSRSGWIC